MIERDDEAPELFVRDKIKLLGNLDRATSRHASVASTSLEIGVYRRHD